MLRRPPILLDEVQFAMVFWVEVAEVAARLHKLLNLRLLVNEVWLRKKEPPTVAVSVFEGAVEI